MGGRRGRPVGSTGRLHFRYSNHSLLVAVPFHSLVHSSLNDSFLMLYSASLAEMLRRDRPQIFAQRPTLPRLFFMARVR